MKQRYFLMYLSPILRTTLLSLLLLPAVVSAAQVFADSTPVSVMIDHDDGGNSGKRHIHNLLAALNKGGCSAVLQDTSSGVPANLLFDSRPVSIVRKKRPDYQLIARAKTLEGELSVRGAILVHSSTGIDGLSSLQGERIAFMGKKSLIGYHLPLQLLHNAGVSERRDTFFYVDNHVGTLSMLLHSDVYVAVTAEPLARRWAEYNNLSIIAVTDKVETGGWWMLKTLTKERMQQCAQALSRLDRSRYKALPAWIGGFEIIPSQQENRPSK
ncbi:MAG: PhnD/SsuA/transferrin family substrate-binding protein [Sedimenticola sp.]